MQRAEELQDWICEVVGQPHNGEHLSETLRDGKLLCLLANVLDPDANVKVNKLSTIFHSKSNINAFLNWCENQQGLMGPELFEPDDLINGKDFNAVLNTLSILYDRFAVETYSDSNYNTDSPRSSFSPPATPSPKSNATMNSKLAAFMNKGFLSKGKSKTPQSSVISPSLRSPENFYSPISPDDADEISSTSSSASNKLTAFLSQVPPSNGARLDHNKRPSGPKKTAPKRQNKPTNAIESPMLPSRNKSPDPRTGFKASLPSPSDVRNKFAAFVKNNPPPAVKQPSFDSNRTIGSVEPKKTNFDPAPQKTKLRPVGDPPKAPPTKAPSSSSSGNTNKLKAFMMQQPPSNAPSSSGYSSRSQNKLQAFMASTGTSSSSGPVSVNKSASLPRAQPIRPRANMSSSRARARSRSSRAAVSGRIILNKSAGRYHFVQRRGTYWSQRRTRSKFSLEQKRKAFMKNQLEVKEEEMRRKAKGEASTQNLILPGVQCYVPDKDDIWLLSEVVDYNEKRKEVKVQVFLDDGTPDEANRIVDLKDPEVIRALAGPTATSVDSLPIAIPEDTMEGVQDMRHLRYLNEPSILFNLKLRFQASSPYTYTNDIVIAVNPYKWIDDLYGDHLHDQYLRKPRDSLPPHVYATSTAAYMHMKRNEMNQSILVSGESGAGKTETTKIVMNHLASVAGGRNDKTISKVIEVNPLLESFGNAKTVRNDNSSRFGKFTQLQFNERGKLIGAKCETYLLEKSRVVSITAGERNYHIFYQMLSGLSSRELQEFGLDASHRYNYTGALREMLIDGWDDKKLFASTRNSLSLIGLDAKNQKVLFTILAGIMHMGELEFSPKGESGSQIKDYAKLSHVARMFGLPDKHVEEALCNRTVVTRNDAVTVPLPPVEAAENRDALAKTIYSKMFDWMVTQINGAISSEEGQISGQIGVLDIFGFEDFAHNGFEQFCINYANEKLQQKFTTDVFKTVQEEYIREGLQWDHIEFQDNQEIVEIIDGKMGILAIMNDHLRQPRGTEEALVNKFKTNHHKKKNGEFSQHIDFPKVKRTQFIINHYAGSVTYETVGFMEKHRDTLQKDLLDLIKSTKLALLMDFFDEPEVVEATNARNNKAASKSLGAQFKTSLKELMENISSTNTHYIRCIKPNSNKSPTEFNKKMVVEQLRSAGVIEAIRITRSGYPSRLSPQELATRYAIMFPPSMRGSDYRKTCTTFMNAIGHKSPKEYQLGRTLVYFRNGVIEGLEAMKSDFYYLEATTIQKVVLGFIERRRFARIIQAVITIQSLFRMVIERQEFKLKRRAARRIQQAWHRYITAEPPREETEEEEQEDQFPDEPHTPRDVSTRQENPAIEDDDNGFLSHDDGTPPTTPPGKSALNRLAAFRDKMGFSSNNKSVKRMEDPNPAATPRSKKGDDNDILQENQRLRKENARLKQELELVREQCVELQEIILEINRRRRR